MALIAVVFIVGLCVLSIGLPLWVAWKTRHGDVRILGICARGWVSPWAVIAAGCAIILLATQLPGLLTDHDPQAPVGFFFFGVVVCALFPLSLLVGRAVLAVRRILHGCWVDSNGTPEMLWLLNGAGICAVISAAVVLHCYNTSLIVAVSNPDASPEVLRAIYVKTRHLWIDYKVKLKIAEHRHIPQDVINLIADSGDSGVRLRIASNPSTGVAVLEKFASDKDLWMRVSVARRDDCPDKLLEKLSSDAQGVVRRTALEQIKKRAAKHGN